MRTILFFLLVISLFQCKNEDKISTEQTLPQDFEKFFIQFHVDSTYQLNHIIFPLEGTRKSTEEHSNDIVTHFWNKKGWIIHKTFDDHGGSFTRSFHMVGNLIVEKISDGNELFMMERRFAKLDDDWFLIFYGINI